MVFFHPETVVLQFFPDLICYLIKLQEALQMQRDRTTRFVSRNNKSDLQAHSRSLVFVPFDRPCDFLLVFIL